MNASPSLLKASRPVLRGPLRLLGSALFAASLLFGVAGCKTSQVPSTFNDAELRARAVTASRQGVSVMAAVLSAEDSRRMFGADVNKTGVQSVWIELQNQTPEPLWLLRPGSDPDYFSPLEVAWSVHTPLAREANARIDDEFDRLAFKSPILPGETRAGVLFINPEHLTRLLNIDLLRRKGLIPFSLFLPVPDDAADPHSGTIAFSYPNGGTHRLQGSRRAARGAGAVALLRERRARHHSWRSPQRHIRGRASRHRSSARAPQLPPRRPSRGRGPARLWPRTRLRVAQAGASWCTFDLDSPVACPYSLRRPPRLHRSGRTASGRAFRASRREGYRLA